VVSTSFPRYQLEAVVRRVIDQHVQECDERSGREGDTSTEHFVTGVVLTAKPIGDGRYTIGTLADELEGAIYTILWDPRTDATDLREED